MSDRYGRGDWQSRKDRLMKAYHDMENNPLWKDMLEDCVLRAGDYDTAAASAMTDREAAKFHGMAAGLRTMLSRALEIREARMAYFASEQLKEEYEFGKDTDAAGAGRQADHSADSRSKKIERRRIFADVPGASALAARSAAARDDAGGD